MAWLRSVEVKSLIVSKKLLGNTLPTCREVIEHYHYIQQLLMDTDTKFLKKTPGFNDIKDVVMNDIVQLWRRASLPAIELRSIHTKLKQLIHKFAVARKRAKKLKLISISDGWLDQLFDITKCRCEIPDIFQTYKGKLICSCSFDHRVPEKEIMFLKDQRSDRRMILSSSKDALFNIHKLQSVIKLKRRTTAEDDIEIPTSSKLRATINGGLSNSKVLFNSLRPRQFDLNITSNESNDDVLEAETSDNVRDTSTYFDLDYQPAPKHLAGGKAYLKKRSFSISTSDCVKADRRLVSIRQQSDLQRSTVGEKNISASPTTVLRKREQCRLEALNQCEEELKHAKAIQLCYDGKIINKMDRYIFLGQFVNTGVKCEKVIAVKTFLEGISVTSQTIFNCVTEQICEESLSKIYSVMSDTTALNTGKKSGVNKRLADFFMERHGRGIHTLECLFHVNEIYFTHVISKIEGQKKGPGAMQDGALMNHFSEIKKPDLSHVVDRVKLSVPITGLAALHLRKKAEWFSSQIENGSNDHSFRNDHVCLLALACYLVMDVPENMRNLLVYKQEPTCHARWITTASGYLRLLIFNVCKLDGNQKEKLTRLVSYIVSVYLPSFLLIHLMPSAAEGPGIMIVQRNFLLAYRDLDSELADVALKYFYDHALQWLTPINISLSVFSEVPPYSVEAVKTVAFPQSVDARSLLRDRKAGLRNFFTAKSKTAPCMMCCDVPETFWKKIENNNRATERMIGKLKGVVNNRIIDNPSQAGKTDARFRAFLCN